ncbi:beta-galactosidase [Cohnella endophytica]|uniref:Beta-galactosidase n=1 Tax=Cohnella endophytica TaxID=2419778 RepID=A0A494XGJ6_9BACL|nr:glycoside hydrolase family 2 TIM barrel-domain containing protein [Cohnella endophytica]RKP49867.1 beta-galactosidase [Cohnella endophytica]
MRQILNFNTEWSFYDRDLPQCRAKQDPSESHEVVHLPHANKLVPHHYFGEAEYQFVSWYRRPFGVPAEWRGRRLIVEFDGVMSVAEVFVNGIPVGGHLGGYTSFAIDITDAAEIGERNVLAVRVDSTRQEDVPPEGRLVDYMLFGGIYRDVRMIVTGQTYIDWADHAWPEAGTERATLASGYRIVHSGETAVAAELTREVLDREGRVVNTFSTICELEPGASELRLPSGDMRDPRLWSLDDPYLYEVVTRLRVIDGERKDGIPDEVRTRVGIRSAEFRKDSGFYLNGERLKLRGLNRHQTYPYVGGAMCDRGQRADADLLKFELGLNFVRSSHYPADPSFLDRCDEIGLLVFEEMPGWQFIGDEAWQEVALRHVEEMIVRDRNHPSIFLWGVRINESGDNGGFYRRTNELARNLDPSRPTGGVRAFRDSEMLEDVFTYNDFTRNREGIVLPPNQTPYLITEYMGHMYPTKAYDSVERLIKHALGHAKIQNSQYGDPGIAGAAGWCAFDYNTHRDFGSGDRICYHGVCDLFRLPKFAAHFYRSQQAPSSGGAYVFIARYLVPSFNEDYGDVVPVFTNCEEAELFVNGEKAATGRPDYVGYPSLPFPPIVFQGCNWWEWGASMVSSLKVVGKIGGVPSAEHEIFPFGLPSRLSLQADASELIADGSDCARVIVRLQDDRGQTLHLSRHAVSFRIEGPGRLIGENPFVLEAGRGGVYVQASREPGTIRLFARAIGLNGLAEAEIEIGVSRMRESIVPVSVR